MQHAGNEAFAPVIDLHFARHYADALVAEWAGESKESLRGDDAVGIHRDKYLASADAKSGRKGGPLSLIKGEAQSSDAVGVASRFALNVLPCIVGAAVIDHDDFELIEIIVRIRHRVDGIGYHRALVVCGNDDGHARSLFDGRMRMRAVFEPEKGAEHRQQEPHGKPKNTGPVAESNDAIRLSQLNHGGKDPVMDTKGRQRGEAQQDDPSED